MTDAIAEIERQYAFNTAPRIGMEKKPAVLVVDFIEGFTNKNSTLAGDWDEQVKNTAKLIDMARDKGLLIIFTTVEFSESDLSSNLLI